MVCVCAEVAEALANMAFPHIYPDPESRALRTLLAEECGVPIGNILVGCGADELIDLLMRCVLSPGACAYPPPHPSSYEHVRVCVGGGVAFSKHVGTHTPSPLSHLSAPSTTLTHHPRTTDASTTLLLRPPSASSAYEGGTSGLCQVELKE